jgi:hypothetical protein
MTARASIARVESAVLAAGGTFRPAGSNTFRSLGICHGATRSDSLLFSYDSGRGRVGVHCFAACSFDQILDALGLAAADLYDEPRSGQSAQVAMIRAPRPVERPKPRVYTPPPVGWEPPADQWTPCGHGKLAEYLYRDEEGRVLFGVVRCPRKDFFQWRPLPARPYRRWRLAEKDGSGHTVAAVRMVPYRLPELVAAVEAERAVWFAEGEKDVAALVTHDCEATTIAKGASSWRPEYAPYFRGAHLTIVADRDVPGRKLAEALVASLSPVVASLEVVVAAHGKDAHDHFAAGGTVDSFVSVGTPKCLEPSR